MSDSTKADARPIMELGDIRVGTQHDWQDASELAGVLLLRSEAGDLAAELFAATVAYLAYSGERFQASWHEAEPDKWRLAAVVFFVFDPCWDSAAQTIAHIFNFFSTEKNDVPCAAKVAAITDAVLKSEGREERIFTSFLDWRRAILADYLWPARRQRAVAAA